MYSYKITSNWYHGHRFVCAGTFIDHDMREMAWIKTRIILSPCQTSGRCQSANQHTKLIQEFQRRKTKFALEPIGNRFEIRSDFSNIIRFGVHSKHFAEIQDTHKTFSNFVTSRIRIGTDQNTFVCWSNDFFNGGNQSSSLPSSCQVE